MDVLRRMLALTPPVTHTLRAWWDATATERALPTTPPIATSMTIDRALIGGVLADRLGFAFASGYAEALRALVPGLDGISALCATEEGGNHPRAIRTQLVAAGDRFVVTGNKKWATLASEASQLLVVASVGEVDGKNRLRVVRIPVTAPGVTLRPSAAPFVPEIPHAEVELAGVEVDATAVLPGDGYDDYLKPFRTVEDLHVQAALAGYLIGVVRRSGFSRDLLERLLAIASAIRALGVADRASPTTHLALAGTIELMARSVAEVEAAWAAAPPHPEHDRWLRDRELLRVAGTARAARRERARATIEDGRGTRR